MSSRPRHVRRRSDIADIMRSLLEAEAGPRDPEARPAYDRGMVHVLQSIGRALGINPGWAEKPIGTVYGERFYRREHIEDAIAGARAAAGPGADPVWDNTIGVLLTALGLGDSAAADSPRPVRVDPPRRQRRPAAPTVDTYRIEGAEGAGLAERLGRYGFQAAVGPAEGGACLQVANVGDRAEWADRIIGQWAEAAGATVAGQAPAADRQPRRRRYE